MMPDVVSYFCDSLLLMTPSQTCQNYTHNSFNGELKKEYLSVGLLYNWSRRGATTEALPSETPWLEGKWWGGAMEIKVKSTENMRICATTRTYHRTNVITSFRYSTYDVTFELLIIFNTMLSDLYTLIKAKWQDSILFKAKSLFCVLPHRLMCLMRGPTHAPYRRSSRPRPHRSTSSCKVSSSLHHAAYLYVSLH